MSPWPGIGRLLAVLALAPLGAAGQPGSLRAPNVVEISPRLVTSGQPSADALAKLGAQGFEAVIYLAPRRCMMPSRTKG